MRTGGVLPGGAYQTHREFLDFIVDGRPLLLRLDDVDAVSPLAADLGPTVFTTHVRRLLTESEAPLSGGRYVIYGCPECEGLDCGAVTAVIERKGERGAPDEAIVWRDFAWQTGEAADLARDGYPGIGPFHFRAEEYRAVLERLIAAGEPEPAPRRVLLVGQRAAVLQKLAAALRGIGIGAEISRDAAGAHADELRTYGAVAFGQAVSEEERSAVRAAFAAAGVEVPYVDGLAPVIPVLVAQIEQALDRGPAEQRRLTALRAQDGAVTLEVAAACGVRLTLHRLDRLYRTHTHELLDTLLAPGTHRITLHRRATPGRSYVVARTTGSVLVTPVIG
ncbi:oxidoreductase [Streptomyces gobiensis]|uniref:oxidoreductase n=1 Tax=Streptomyces gobiensis TaxID=2875706 RepID=UPI001E42F359|nr:oxidoreductase [Streptomyces gobiensis]UGY95288.1 oxidoreductase [Streptomyces gobiensis]